MPWWGWMMLGTLLLGAELFGVNAQFYLVFIGAAALAVGAIELGGMSLPEWAQWLVFATLSLALMGLFRARLYRRFRAHPAEVDEHQLIGGRIRLDARLEPQAEGRVEYRGSTWTARNIDERALEAGDEAEIRAVAGLTLHLRHPG